MKKRGFSYIEVLIALSITAIIFTGVLPLLFNSVEKNRDTRLKLIAYETALNKIEALREAKIPSLCANPLPQTTPCDEPFSVPEIPTSTGHTYILKNLGDQRIASVDVVINWTLKGKTQEVRMKTYLYGGIE